MAVSWSAYSITDVSDTHDGSGDTERRSFYCSRYKYHTYECCGGFCDTEFRMDAPGFYVKISIEDYLGKKAFRHLDFNMSFNNGTIDDGTVRESRFCLNYGIGWT